MLQLSLQLQKFSQVGLVSLGFENSTGSVVAKYCRWGNVLKMTCMKKLSSSKRLGDVCVLSVPLIGPLWLVSCDSHLQAAGPTCPDILFIYLNRFLKHKAELSISSASNFRNGLRTVWYLLLLGTVTRGWWNGHKVNDFTQKVLMWNTFAETAK